MGKKILLILGVVLILVGAGFVYARAKFKSGELQMAVARQVIKQVVALDSAPKEQRTQEQNVLQQVLGFDKPQTYLVLFLNNTELRPGGGFIGAYAVIKIDKGTPHILKVEGTEIFDNQAPQNFPSVPPEPIAKYLKVKRWAFRDSNWSPDFAVASQKTLELYAVQQGVAASDISAVIGITPTVMEEILRLTGPITLNGETYTSDDFTQKLEYEVEYGYANKGQTFSQRKQALQDLTGAMMARLTKDVFLHWGDFWALAQKLLAEKQIIAYSSVPSAQDILVNKNWAGTFTSSTGDWLLYADANLGALKTDAVLKRELSYSLRPVGEHYQATLTMKYIHEGKYDWRTTRYLTYARLYAPLGAKLIQITGSAKSASEIASGEELGKSWFGVFAMIEPGRTKELVFQYQLPAYIEQQMKAGTYILHWQKQLGLGPLPVRLDLDFGKTVQFAAPSEEMRFHGDGVYNVQTSLGQDKDFRVTF